jgi:alpha-glucosidase (family GH31 glycosyl hydrolase)
MNDTYKAIAKRAMLDRYSYLRHMYTCLFEAYKYGGSCFDPLFYSFPADENVYTDMESTFIVGGALKVTPILKSLGENETTMEAYFPAGTWVNINDGTYFAGNKSVNLSTTGSLNVHMKPGSIVSFQDNSDNKTTTTADLSSKPISLYVNRDDNGYASGSLFLDQGISLTELSNSTYEYYQFHL